MKLGTKSILKKILGIILIIIGLAALFTPLTPGSWLALIGLQLLGFGFLLENRIGRAIKNKFKNSKRKVEQISHHEQPPSQIKNPK